MRMYKTGETCPLCGQVITTTDPEELMLLSELAATLSLSGPGQMTVREYAAAQGISMQAVYQQIHAGKLNVAMRGDASKPRMYILLDPEEPAPVRQIVPAEPDAVYCSLFTCSLRRGNYCCSSCPRRERCSNACQNSPERCRATTDELRQKRRSP